MKHDYTVARNTFFQEKIKNEWKRKRKQTKTYTTFIVVLIVMRLSKSSNIAV